MDKARVYSQVNSILNELGENYISKLPKKMYSVITSKKDNKYNPEYDISKSLTKQEVYKDTIAIICYFHKKFWCKGEREKRFIEGILKMNDIENGKNKDLFSRSSGDSGKKSDTKETSESSADVPVKKKKDVLDKLLEHYLDL